MTREYKESMTLCVRVAVVEEKMFKRWTGGTGKDAKFVNTSLGWYIGFEGSRESQYYGSLKPNIKVGDEAIIRIGFYAKP